MSEERVVKVSGQCALTDEEICVAITRLNEAKRYGDSECVFSFSAGQLVQRGNITIRTTQGAAPTDPVIEIGGKATPSSW